MIGRNFILKMRKFFSEDNAKIFA